MTQLHWYVNNKTQSNIEMNELQCEWVEILGGYVYNTDDI